MKSSAYLIFSGICSSMPGAEKRCRWASTALCIKKGDKDFNEPNDNLRVAVNLEIRSSQAPDLPCGVAQSCFEGFSQCLWPMLLLDAHGQCSSAMFFDDSTLRRYLKAVFLGGVLRQYMCTAFIQCIRCF